MNSNLQPNIDQRSARYWVYPTNYPPRDYQINICKQALFINTLVCLPTGLGKTLIAAVVMYNFYCWFPTGMINILLLFLLCGALFIPLNPGKVIFLAPSKPLVQQQISACHDIMGIPECDTAHLEGSVQAEKRRILWESKRVFFCTPQTLLNDIQAGRCDPRHIVCLVIDEAHKATDNYAYTTAVEEIGRVSDRFRILALSATPGSDIRKIQNVQRNFACHPEETNSLYLLYFAGNL